MTRSLRRFALLVALLPTAAFASDQWIVPTPAELTMTSIPEVPGAPAFILYREETADDTLHMRSVYMRVKVLTDGGKERANVELPYYTGTLQWQLDSITGRTVHPDGTIVPFTGKPYDKLITRVGGYKVQAKVFTLPAVEVGSIIEYRYKLHYSDDYFSSPDWFIQTDMFLRKGHYSWKPTEREMVSDEGVISGGVAWTPILPAGAVVKQETIGGARVIQLDVQDIPALPQEASMPPVNSFSYRVLFYYTGYRTMAEYWSHTGKSWSKERDKFIGPYSHVKSAVGELVQASDADDVKLHKIYAAVTAMDNTDLSREHTNREDHAAGLREIQNTDDILDRKRGSGDQLTELFVAMVRAAGMHGYLMGIADRKQRFFLASYLSTSQLDDYIAIVSSGGKDLYFDPGQRYCAFGHVAWQHTLNQGLRQTEKGAEIAQVLGEGYKESRVSRIADLQIDDTGVADGTVVVTYTGDPALVWRQDAARGDDTSLNQSLRENMEGMLPGGMEVRVTKVENLTDAEKPLTITYAVKGAVGSPTGKRLLVPGNLFEMNAKTRFTADKRVAPVDLRYASFTQDAVRFKLPASMVIESAPTDDVAKLQTFAVYATSSKRVGSSITLYRNVSMGKVLFTTADYGELRAFYQKMESRDQEPLVLTRAPAAAAGGN